MTDRGPLSADGSPACPFVAFEDDRDERADRPDHRHRCYAESEPAPRALAHQEAYCLSSAFPVCPTFQEWARREAAHASHVAATAEAGEDGDDAAGMAAAGVVAGAAGEAEEAEPEIEDLWSRPPDEPPIEERPKRNPPRDWAAPPPWAASAAAGAAAASRAEPPGQDASRPTASAPKEGQGLAGSAADRLAQGKDVPNEWRRPTTQRPSVSESPATEADPELAGLVGGASAVWSAPADAVVPPTRPPANRPSVSSTRDRGREREREREKERVAAEAASQHDGPSWERRRRFEAYPTIRTRTGLPAIPTVAILFGGVVLAAVALFFLPALLGIGGGNDNQSSPTPSAVESSAPPSPTPVPAPTPQTYTIKSGDTLSKIARKFGVSLDALLAANKDTISNPNRIRVGDEIIIPLPETEQVPAAPSAAPSAS
jgi:nucleoid-associated protein YgaU